MKLEEKTILNTEHAQISIKSSGDSPEKCKDNLIIFLDSSLEPTPLFKKIDKSCEGLLSQLIEEGEISGKKKEFTIVHTFGKLPAKRVIVVGIGEKDAFDLDQLRSITADILRSLRDKNILELTIPADDLLSSFGPLSATAQTIGEAAIMAMYSFKKYVQNSQVKTVKNITVTGDKKNISSIESGLDKGIIIGDATSLTRDMANEPANICTPRGLSMMAEKVAQDNDLAFECFDEKQMTKMGMGLIMAVGQGSPNPPRLMILDYKPKGQKKVPTVALVGKAVTFDTGGVCIKPSANMSAMKRDMTGGATAIGVISAIAKMKLPIRLIALVPSAENMLGTNAVKPSDMLYSYSGKTVEMINTDAEGRLVMADALSYAQKHYKLDFLMDVATLTGGIKVALGTKVMGILGNNPAFMDLARKASQDTGEMVWELPLIKDYRPRVLSHFADLKNSSPKPPSSINAGLFLNEFVDPQLPWIHFDIAGCDTSAKDSGYTARGATACAVRLLIDLIEKLSIPSLGK